MRPDDKQIAEKSFAIDGHEHAVRVFAMRSRPKSMWRPYSGKQSKRKAKAKDPMEGKKIIGFFADDEEIEALRKSGLSWREVADRLGSNPTVELSRAEAAWLTDRNRNLARWIHHRLVISTRLVRRLSDLSALLGFDRNGTTVQSGGKTGLGETGEERRARIALREGHAEKQVSEKLDWIGPFIRAQFLKSERKEGCDVRTGKTST